MKVSSTLHGSQSKYNSPSVCELNCSPTHCLYVKNSSNKISFIIFDVLLTVNLSIFVLAVNQLDAQNLFHNKFISCLYMFRASYAHRQEVKIALYSLWYRHTETSEWSKITKIYMNMST